MAKLAVKGGEPVRKEPFPEWPIYGEEEERLLLEVLKSRRWTIGGEKIKQFQQEFAEFHDAKYGVACSSGWAALVITLKALGVGRGDKVLVPAYTFAATATAVIDSGATPIFTDINPETLSISVEDAEQRVTDDTKCIIPVHVAGCPADMDEVLSFANGYGLKVLEDAAQAHGAEWRGRKVGSIGDAGIFSFYQSKNMTSGEGGIVITNKEEIADLAWSYHNVGRDKKREWYELVRYGWNFRMTEFQAAILIAQLRRLPALVEKREKAAEYLSSRLSEIEGVEPVRKPREVTKHAYHLYIFKIDKEIIRKVTKQRFIEALRAEGIPCSPGYKPLYEYEFLLERLDETSKKLKLHNTEEICSTVIWLPQNILLGGEKDLDDVATAVEKILKNLNELS